MKPYRQTLLAGATTFASVVFFASLNSAQLSDRYRIQYDKHGNPELATPRYFYRGQVLHSLFISECDSVFADELALNDKQTAGVRENFDNFRISVRDAVRQFLSEEIEFSALAKTFESKTIAANQLLQKNLNKEQLVILRAAVLRSRIYKFGLVDEIGKGSLSTKGLNSPDVMNRIRSKSQSIESKFLQKLRTTQNEQLAEFLKQTDSDRKFEQVFGKWPKKSIPVLTLIKKFDSYEHEPTSDVIRPQKHSAINALYPFSHVRYRQVPRRLLIPNNVSVQRDDSFIYCYLRYLMSDEVLLRELDLTDKQDDKIYAFLQSAEKKIKPGATRNRAAGEDFGRSSNAFAELESSLVKEMKKHVGFKRSRKVEHLTIRFYFQLLGYKGFVSSKEMQLRLGVSRRSIAGSLKTLEGQESRNQHRKKLREIENWYFKEMLGDSKATELQKRLAPYDGKFVHHVDALYLHHKRFTEDLARAKKSK